VLDLRALDEQNAARHDLLELLQPMRRVLEHDDAQGRSYDENDADDGLMRDAA
jgi:hypothetical protein